MKLDAAQQVRYDFLVARHALEQGWVGRDGLMPALREYGRPGRFDLAALLARQGALDESREAAARRFAEQELDKPLSRSDLFGVDQLFREISLKTSSLTAGQVARCLLDQGLGENFRPIWDVLHEKGFLESQELGAFRKASEARYYRRMLRALVGLESGSESTIEHGWQLGDFQVLEEIGRGGMGIIFRARQKILNRIVALKILHPAQMSDVGVKRFLREAEAVSRLRHPHIVNIHQVGEFSGIHFFTMRFVDGTSLDRMVGERESIDVPRAAGVVRKLADALGYAHTQGIVHRDVKPGNILIERETGEPFLTDFGLVRDVKDQSNLTREGVLLGTPMYMSPEQASGEPVGPASDIYSLGTVLYQLTAGVLPHQADSAISLYMRIVNEDPPSPAQFNPEIPTDLQRIIQTAMAKKPWHRFRNAAEMADDLGRFLEGERTLARPPGRLVRWKNRLMAIPLGHLLWIGAAVALVGAGAALLAGRFSGQGRGGEGLPGGDGGTGPLVVKTKSAPRRTARRTGRSGTEETTRVLKLEERLADSEGALQRRRFGEALAGARSALALARADQERRKAYLLVAAAYVGLGDHRSALEYYDRVLVYRTDPGVLWKKGTVLFAARRYREAGQVLEEARRRGRADALLLYNLAMCYFHQDMLELAVTTMEGARNARLGWDLPYLWLGKFFMNLKQYFKARGYFDGYIEKAANPFWGFFHRAEANVLLGEKGSALEDYRNALRASPRQRFGHYRKLIESRIHALEKK